MKRSRRPRISFWWFMALLFGAEAAASRRYAAKRDEA